MNEEKMDQAMASYRESLGTCSKQPVRMPARRNRIGFALATAGVTALVLAVALWPKDAVAESLKRVGLAIKNARTMEVRSFMKTSSGKWHEFNRAYYKDGVWRYQTRKGSGLASTIVVRDGMALFDYDRLDHATLDKADPSFLSMMQSEMSALDYAKRGIDQGQVGIERKVSLETGTLVNGRPTYRIAFVRAEDQYKAEIVVDKQTDLPISTYTTVKHTGNPISHHREEYRFNHNLSNALFQLESKKPVIRLSSEQDKLTKAWAKEIAKVGKTSVRDVSVTHDGTVWVACTLQESDRNLLPTTLLTSDGQPYVKSLDINPSAIQAKEGVYSFRGDEVIVVGFLPLDCKQPKPNRVKLMFANRTPHYPGHSAPERQAVADGPIVVLDVRQAGSLERPSYFPALDLDYFGFQLPIVLWEERAKALHERGRLVEAARAYEQTAVEYRNFVKYVGYRPLEKAAKIYRELGLSEVADARQSEADSLRAGRER